MTLVVSIIAIVISLTSLAFSFHQHKRSQLVNKLEKSNDLLKQSCNLRKASQDIRNKIDTSDDIEDFTPILNTLDISIETQIMPLLQNTEISINDLYKIGSSLLNIDMELELLSKQVNEGVDFNNEVAALKNS